MPITTGFSQTVNTTINGTTTATTNSATNTPLPPVALINLILADVNAVLPNFNGLVSSYRLLVGSAEEIYRTPEVCHDVFERAVRRYDNTGLLIDVLLELLCCKIIFSSELLRATCGPIDLFRYLLTCLDGDDTPCRSAQTVVGLEALKRMKDKFCEEDYCLPYNQVLCPKQPEPPKAEPATPPTPPASQPTAEPAAVPIICESDIADIIETKLISILNKYNILPSRDPETAILPHREEDLENKCNNTSSHIIEESHIESSKTYSSRLRPKYLPGDAAKKKRDDS